MLLNCAAAADTCVTKEVHNQCEESFSLDQAGIANMGFSNNFSTIAAGAAQNISTLFSIHDTFYNADGSKGMRPDWQAAWAALQTELVPFIENRSVVGFFVGCARPGWIREGCSSGSCCKGGRTFGPGARSAQ